MNNFGDRLKYLMDVNKESQLELSKSLGLIPSAISNYVSGRRTPNYEILCKIAKHYNVSTDYLLMGDKKTEHMRNAEKDFIYSMYNQLNDRDKEIVLEIMKNLLK